MIRPKPCVVCGRRVEDGSSRCDAHKIGGRRARSCVVCGRTSLANYCPAHDPAAEEERIKRNPYRLAYKDPDYRRNRQLRFERARGRCEWQGCGIELVAGQWECDHLVELVEGGTNAVENLRVLCKAHHRMKTAARRKSRRAES